MLIHNKLSKYKIEKIITCFCLDLNATQTGILLGLNRNTINRYFSIFRNAIYENQQRELQRFSGEIEIDESYFGPKRVKGKAITRRGRGTHKQPVFGILERNGRVYTQTIPDCKKKTVRAIILGKIDLGSIIYSDSWSGYSGLVDVGYNKHLRINHKKNEFSDQRGIHINGIEAFWSFTKRRLAKFNGVKKNFDLHLKECEWRWSRNNKKLERELVEILRKMNFC